MNDLIERLRKCAASHGWTGDPPPNSVAALHLEAAAAIEAARVDAAPAIWVVGDTAFTSEAEAIEEIRQWGPSGAIARAYYANPLSLAGFMGTVDCCSANGAWLVLTDDATDITKGQRVFVVTDGYAREGIED